MTTPRESPPPGQSLPATLEEWLRLTGTEAGCIERGDWTGVREAQESKERIMRRWDEAIPTASQTQQPRVVEESIRPLVARIKDLEAANRVRLEARIEGARRELAGLGASARNLKQLQTAYKGRTEAGWQWYS